MISYNINLDDYTRNNNKAYSYPVYISSGNVYFITYEKFTSFFFYSVG